MPLRRDRAVELLADFVVPPTAFRMRRDDGQPMLVELLHERRFVVQSIQMHAVQIQRDIPMRAAPLGHIDIARMPRNRFFGPGSWHGTSSRQAMSSEGESETLP